jgi:hypothetical protein
MQLEISGDVGSGGRFAATRQSCRRSTIGAAQAEKEGENGLRRDTVVLVV